jgi:hypothetical protein
MPKGSVSRPGQKMLKTRPVPGGAQQYVRGDTARERYRVARKAVDTADNAGGKGRQSLASASAYEGLALSKQLAKQAVDKDKRAAKLAAVRRPKTLAKQKAPVGKGGR